MRYLTPKCSIYITEFKTNITTSYNCNPIRNRFQFECMVTSNYSLPCRSFSAIKNPMSSTEQKFVEFVE